MIPTRYKAKLPRHLSYPIGAEALSEALSGAPNAESLSVAFRDSPVWPASEFKRILASRLPYRIVAVEYHPARRPGYGGSRSMVEGGWFDEKWELTVYPVIRELRQVAGRLLREQGLAYLMQWLRSSQKPGWVARDHRIELIFSPTEECISPHEESGV